MSCSDGLIAGNVDTYEIEGLKTVGGRRVYPSAVPQRRPRIRAEVALVRRSRGAMAPLGFARTGERRLLEPIDGPDLGRVRRAFALYATGAWSDTALADELGLTEAGLAEILTNPLYAGRVIRHKGQPDEEERPARFAAPGRPGAVRPGPGDPEPSGGPRHPGR